ncbi:MAG TPA: YlxR family protein [Kineosporiaceae bacterium]|nr:YlxR family protein [Kineosporiaceae bacterium]
MGCRVRDHWSVLLRVAVSERDGIWSVVPDPRRRLGGRGAWLHPDPACLDLAERRRAFPRALRLGGPLDTAVVREYLAVCSALSPPEPSQAGSGSEADEHPMSTQR